MTARGPEAPDHDEQRPVRRVYGAPGPIRTLAGADAAVNAYERRARTRDGMAPMETPVELEPIEVLRAEGERGRRYRAEWIRSGAAAERPRLGTGRARRAASPSERGATPQRRHRSGRTRDRQDLTVEDPSTTGSTPQSEAAEKRKRRSHRT